VKLLRLGETNVTFLVFRHRQIPVPRLPGDIDGEA
jgi:hypothetical protein